MKQMQVIGRRNSKSEKVNQGWVEWRDWEFEKRAEEGWRRAGGACKDVWNRWKRRLISSHETWYWEREFKTASTNLGFK